MLHDRSKRSQPSPRPKARLGRRGLVPVAVSVAAAIALAVGGSLVGLGASVAAGSGGKHCSSSATKCFGLSISPKTAPPGSSTKFKFTVTNDAPTQNLGSLEVSKPAGFKMTGASTPRGKVVTTATTALFTTLTVGPGGAVTFFVTATAPCTPETYRWGIQVKQSNNFSGTGNTFAIAKTTATTVGGHVTAGTGGCSVAFVPTSEPRTTVRTSPILNGFDSTGSAVEAAVYTHTGAIAATFTGSITLSLSQNPTGATLSGGKAVTEPATNGVASFSTLSVNLVGSGYQLEATSPGLTATPPTGLSPFSSLFSIYTQLVSCTTSSCSAAGGTTSKGKTRIALTETTTSAPLGGFIGFGFGGSLAALTFESECGATYLVPAADIASTDVFNHTGVAVNESGSSTTWTVVYEITKSIVKSSGQNGASQWQVCYVSTTPFTTASGAQAIEVSTTSTDVSYYVGLLPTSELAPGMPYIKTRHKDNAGDELITIKASGDGFIRP
ncbi:MAG: hypothetical protein M0Z46_10890 [Actinomycetota bacterium]|nr:hypothetical protein [Actinomycetota bacterium]